MNRRDFLKGASLTSLGMTIAATEMAEAQAKKGQAKPAANTQKPAPKPAANTPEKWDDELAGRPVKIAVIGLGPRGREILAALGKMTDKYAPVTMICDSFTAPVHVKKSQAIAPKARFEADYRKVLEDKDVEAVFIATPTHLHREMAIDAVRAGKHVYCEAPLAHTIEDSRAIAQAAKSAGTIFQPGLQVRCSPQAEHVWHFIATSVMGKVAGGRGQWHQRTSWRFSHPDDARQRALNWRLNRETSNGLLGEVGMHQIDTASWYFKGRPIAVSASGAILEHSDGRDVQDTVQAMVEYPGDVRFMYNANLISSFDDTYELFWGNEATIMLRDQRGWMFKEAGAGQLGWEVFARKDAMQIGKPENNSGLLVASGIALVADATKQLATGKTELVADASKSALYFATRIFLDSIRAGKRITVKKPTPMNMHPPLAPDAIMGHEATVVGIKCAEAARQGTRIVFQDEWFAV